jgi:hypothetical protein
MKIDGDHYRIALEMYLWCRDQGMSDEAILLSLGYTPRRPVTANYVVDILAALHRGLAHRRRAA